MTPNRTGPPADVRRVQLLIFSIAWVAFAYFHQGGGWNQNARFALVRAIVEEGRFSIDSHLLYALDGGTRLTRLPIRDGRFSQGGNDFAFWWLDAAGRPVPLDGRASGIVAAIDAGDRTVEIEVGRDSRLQLRVPPGIPISKEGAAVPLELVSVGDAVDLSTAVTPDGPAATSVVAGGPGVVPTVTFLEPGQVAATGDLSWAAGHFHPAKAPGTSFLAVPAYFLLHQLDRLAGLDADDVSTLTRNAWLTSVFSVGLVAALGCVIFFRLALDASGGSAVASLLATLTFAFGTLYFPYATTLYEHDIVAVALLGALYLLHRARDAAARLPEQVVRARTLVALAGLCAGYAAITNYVVAGAVVLLGAYLVLSVRVPRGWAWFSLGVLGPFLLICGYNLACFSTPFTTNYAHESPAFQSGDGALLGVFLRPRWEVLAAVLVSPYRGLFFGAPVLVMGAYGLVAWVRRPETRGLAWLSITMTVFFLLVVMTFNGWHGGWAVGPRYLVPAIPFLALPLAAAFGRFFRTTSILAAFSIATMLLVTAVDPQAPEDVRRPLTQYVWPLFTEGRVTPLLEAGRDEALRFYEGTLRANGEPDAARALRVSSLRGQIDAAIDAGEPAPLQVITGPDGRRDLAISDLPTLAGPVSVNPVGFYEGGRYHLFSPRSSAVRWNAFNAGEFAFERSRASLIPLLAVAATLGALAFRWAREIDRRRPG